MRSMKPATPGNRATFFMKQMRKKGKYLATAGQKSRFEK